MLQYSSLALVLLVAFCYARPGTQKVDLWTDCGTNPNRPFIVSFFNVTPNPIEIPGKVKINFIAENKRQIDILKAEIKVERHIWGDYYMTLPCINEQGSCTYENLCEYLENAPPNAEDALQKVQAMFEAGGTPLACPLRKKKIVVKNFVDTLPEIPSFVSYVALGKYRVTVQFRNPVNDIDLGCFQLNIEAKASAAVEDDDEEEEDCWFWC